MFMPHAKPYSPAPDTGGNSTAVRWNAGNARSTTKSVKTTCEVHSPPSLRSKTSGTPWRARMTSS